MSSLPGGGSLCYSSAPFLPKLIYSPCRQKISLLLILLTVSPLRRCSTGRTPLPLFPAPAFTPYAALYRDGDHGALFMARATIWHTAKKSIRLHCSWWSDPAQLAHCAKLAEQRGYDEINLNVGCPSDRVQNGMFGACLMGNAQLVADCVKAMRDVVSIPVTVKTRIGIDDQDSYEFLCDFISTVSGKGECEMFIIHARKAWLSGLSPKENREIPRWTTRVSTSLNAISRI
jgi:tRNA-dihydrouridine synthase A